ncbi:MAG: branched-chain amino acid ABC transporter permease [Deltaproteobacteria bacterium]|nr:branched-chain amino acid ABC transporter permease [Deltaproteobacteria bacterium]MBW2069899.1 branched-chain amino acid ABC transporter permease [Deltaproteobacteria bacterium]
MEKISLTGQIIQYLFTGVTVGSIYALVGLGFNIIYNVTEIINFAQGEFVMLGGLLMVFCSTTLHLALPVAFVLAVAMVTLVGALMERLTINPLKNATVLTLIIVTIAVSILLKGIAMFVWGKDPYVLPPFSGNKPIFLMGAAVQTQTLWVLGLTLAVVVLMTFFFKKTRYGKAMLACADNSEAARLVGIKVKTMVLISFALSAAIGAVAGAAVTPISLMEYDRGALLALKGFGAAVLGGLGSFYGAVVAGLLLGVIESFCAGFVSSGYKDAVALLVLLLVLFLKPSGLFGNVEASKIKKF